MIGVDISPNMIPEDQPDNLDFQIDDLNARSVKPFPKLPGVGLIFFWCSSFTFAPGQFDVVHSQMMCGGIHSNRWRSYIRDMFRVLRPGGWCQMVEIYFNAQSDNGTLTRG